MRISAYYSVNLYERKTIFIFDEVQFFPRARAAIKYLVADGRFHYMETGSLMSIRENVEDIISKGVAKSIIAITLLVIAVLICYVLKDLDVMLTDVMLGISLIALFRKLLLTIINPMYLRNRVMNNEEGSQDAIESSLSATEDKIR